MIHWKCQWIKALYKLGKEHTSATDNRSDLRIISPVVYMWDRDKQTTGTIVLHLPTGTSVTCFIILRICITLCLQTNDWLSVLLKYLICINLHKLFILLNFDILRPVVHLIIYYFGLIWKLWQFCLPQRSLHNNHVIQTEISWCHPNWGHVMSSWL